jgi:molybdopterin synthase sulfur carrier subunit
MAQSVRIKILAFGIIAEKINTKELYLDSIKNIDDLKIWMITKNEGIQLTQMNIAVNRKIVHDNIIFNDGDEIALLPPFSGG